MPFDVRMPDGTLVRNVPDGTTKAQILSKLGGGGGDTQTAVPEEETRLTQRQRKQARNKSGDFQERTPEMSNKDTTIGDSVDMFFNNMARQGNAALNLFSHYSGVQQAVPIYNSKGELVEVRTETEEESIERKGLTRSRDMSEHRLGALPEEGSVLDIASTVTAEVLDPVNLIMAGPLPKQWALRFGVLALQGMTAETAIEAGKQLKFDGEISDEDTLEKRIRIGALVPSTLDALFRGGAFMAKLPSKSIAENTMRKVENKYLFYREGGVNHQSAVVKAMRDVGVIKDDLTNAAVVAGRKTKLNRFELVPETKIGRFADTLATGSKRLRESTLGARVGDKTNQILGTMYNTINRISPKLGYEGRAFEFEASTKLQKANEAFDPWKKAVGKLSDFEIDLYQRAINKNNKGALSKLFVKHPELKVQHEEHLRPLLNGFYKELAESRKVGEEGLDFVEDFFPRVISNREGFFKAVGKDTKKEIETAVKKATEAKQAALDPWEEAQIINNIISKPQVVTGGARKIGTENRRQFQQVPDRLMKFYEKPVQAIEHYIHSVTMATTTRKFLGSSVKLDKGGFLKIEDSIGAKVASELGDLTADEVEKVTRIFKARFGAGEHSPAGSIIEAKNAFYFMTLNDPLNAMVQFGDVPISVVTNGLKPTIEGFIRSVVSEIPGVQSKNLSSMIELGLNRVGQEFKSARTSAKAVDKMFQFTGFKMVDRIGKNTHINAAISNARKWAKTEKGFQKLQREFEGMTDTAGWERIRADLLSGNVTDEVRFLAWNKLSDAQPISLLEMPEWYAANPNGRILFTLKSFMIRQLNLLRAEGVDRIMKGDIVEGTYKLGQYAMFVGLANAGVEHMKAAATGQPVPDFEDAIVWNMVKNVGISQYMVRQGADSPSSAILQLIAPPVSVVDNFVEWPKFLRNVPYGELLYWNFTEEGVQRIQEEQDRLLREE